MPRPTSLVAARSRPGDDDTLTRIWAPSSASSWAHGEMPEVLADRQPEPDPEPRRRRPQEIARGEEPPLVEQPVRGKEQLPVDVPDPTVLEQRRRDEQAVIGRLLDERHDRREVLRRGREAGQARVVEADRHLRGEILEQIAGQAELREDDEAGAPPAGLLDQLVVAGEVRVEAARAAARSGPGRRAGRTRRESSRNAGPRDPDESVRRGRRRDGRRGDGARGRHLGTWSSGACRRGRRRARSGSRGWRAVASTAERRDLLGGAGDLLGEVARDLRGRAASGRSSGSSVVQRSGLPRRSRSQHRVWNRQPEGGAAGDGTSPRRMIRRRRDSMAGSGIGMADRSATVYGWSGSALRSRDDASSTIRPRYITAIRSLMCCTTDRSWAMNRYVSPNWPCSRSRRLMIWAWIETSSALIGSSATIRSGLTASARATPMRWRWPPLNSWGSDRRSRGSARRSRAGSRTVSPRSREVPIPWISSGSPMIPPAVIRGFRLAYGSWKIICIRRRMLAESGPAEPGEVGAVEDDPALRRLVQPDDGSACRALAAARLADEAERLAAARA